MLSRFTWGIVSIATLLGTSGAPAADLLIANYIGSDVKLVSPVGSTPYIPTTFNGPGGALSFPRGITVGPDGLVYVASEGNSRVERYTSTGAFVDVFIPDNFGDLLSVHQVKFGPDGNLYVSTFGSLSGLLPSRVHRFDGMTGADLGTFTTGGGGSDPHGFTWGPDGHLYVSGADGVHKFNGTTGVHISHFISVGGPGEPLVPRDVLFDPDGNLLVVDGTLSGSVLKFNGITGAPMGTFISTGSGISTLQRPEGIVRDEAGGFYLVANTDLHNILRYDSSGTFVDVYASGGGLLAPTKMTFIPEPSSAFVLLLVCGGVWLRRRACVSQ